MTTVVMVAFRIREYEVKVEQMLTFYAIYIRFVRLLMRLDFADTMLNHQFALWTSSIRLRGSMGYGILSLACGAKVTRLA